MLICVTVTIAFLVWQILERQQHLAACYLIIEYTIGAVCQSDELTDDDVSSVLPKLIDMFHGCVFLIDQIIDNVEDKQVRIL